MKIKKQIQLCRIVKPIKKPFRMLKQGKDLILLLLFILFSSTVFAQNTKITIKTINKTLSEVINEIETKSGYTFLVRSSDIDMNQKVSIDVSQKRIEEILQILFKNNGIKYEIKNMNISIFIPQKSNSYINDAKSKKKYSGKVIDEMGVPIIGATIKEVGANTGTVSDIDGNFNLTVSENSRIVVSYVGFISISVLLTDKENYNIVLKEDTKTLDEVIVVGYNSVKRSDLTGSLSSVTNKDFKSQPVTRIDQVLQGRAAGVQVVNVGGAPGGDVSIRVRGANSINGDNNPLYVIDGYIGADFNNLNPNDIESVEVLKDASGTAIYGSRGANGVILITTKKGSKDNKTVEFSSTLSNSTVLKRYDLLNATDFATTVNERNAALGLGPVTFNPDINTNWQNEIFRNAIGQEYQLSVSGGENKTNYMFSGNYLNEEGIIINTGSKKYSFRSNITTNLSEKFRFTVNVTGTRKEMTNTQGNDGKNSPLTQALAWAPTTAVRNADGSFVASDPTGSIAYNPVALALDRNSEYYSSNLNLLTRANYEFIKGLSLDVLCAVDYSNGQGGYYGGKSVSNNIPYNGRYGTEILTLLNTNMLNYTKKFNDHSITLTGIFENQTSTGLGLTANGSNVLFPGLTFYNMTLIGSGSMTSSYWKYGMLSYIGRASYIYKDKYYLTASIRRDGTSKFKGENQFANFPSAAIAWKLSEEPFIKDLDVFHLLKLRMSYGVSGSQAVGSYQTFATYNSGYTSFTSTTQTANIMMGNPQNNELKWEQTKSLDMGLDVSVLKGKISLTVDAYRKYTSDLLMAQTVPDYLGGGSILKNIGESRNSGLDITLNTTPLSTKNFSWNSNVNVSFLENKVIDIGVPIFYVPQKVGAGLSTNYEYVLKPGYSMGSIYALEYLGTWKPNEATEAAKYGNKPGDARYKDINSDLKIDGKDFDIVGSALPTTTFGWNNTFQYKNFSLNIFIQSLLGFDKLNYTYGAAMAGSADARQITHSDIKNRYIPGQNETSDIPAFSSTNMNYVQSTRFIEKGDFIRLKNINLSYELPKIGERKYGIKVYVGAVNLLTLTNYKGIDPESSSSKSDLNQGIDYGSYPNSRKFIAGLTFKF